MKKYFAFALVGLICGCGHAAEFTKQIWGSSTKALEEARSDASVKSFNCDYEECFDAVLGIAKKNKLTIFINEKKRSRLVLMGIPGSVDTTEVGVFFLTFSARETKIEVTSLSLQAKEKAAEMIFKYLGEQFSLVQ